MYGKIFDSMYRGTLYGQWEAIVTFQQMIVLCDKEGFLEITPMALAAYTSIPLDIIKKGIEILESEDPYSRTAGENGKRIIRIKEDRPWGWKIVNHKKYRDMATEEDRRRYMREYMREYRSKDDDVNTNCLQETNSKHELAELTHTDTYTDTNKEIYKENDLQFKVKVPIPKNISLTQKMIDYAESKGWTQDVAVEFERFVTHHKSNGSKFKDWYAAFQKWIQNDIKWHPEHKGQEMVDL